jgi:DNA-binding winged helix-turn-helix (wHTH) protein
MTTRNIRYRFSDFTVSPGRRTLSRAGQEVPLIPRYFDLLVLLLARRGEAVHRRDIFEMVWSDVVVSDGALSQAIRTLRRTLGDDPREPVFIRTVSRHGYRFVHPGVVVETGDTEAADAMGPIAPAPSASPALPDSRDAAIEKLLSPDPSLTDDERREVAEMLHALGTREALERLDRLPGHEAARALLRDTRWDVPGAGPVPLLGQPGGMKAVGILIATRMQRAARLAGGRWASASAGGAAAGIIAGLIGGSLLRLASGGDSPPSLPAALALIGALIGAVGAAGVGAGLAMAEALARSRRALALVCCGALGGLSVGFAAHLLGRWTLEDLFGHDLSAVGGGIEGLAIGAAAGLGYALATPRPEGGMATPKGTARLFAALVTGICCAAGGVALTWMGRNLGGPSLEIMAHSFQGSRVSLTPLARLLGEPVVGPVTRTALSAYEGLLFGIGLILGLTRRPR